MGTVEKKSGRKPAQKKSANKRIVKLTDKRKNAIEKAISFWEAHSVDMNDFKFNQEEANAR